MTAELNYNNGTIKIKWIKKHSLFQSSPGDIDYVSTEAAMTLVPAGYAKQIIDQDEDSFMNRLKTGKKITRVKFLRAAPGWAYSEGSIADLKTEDVEELINKKYVQAVSANYKDPVLVKAIIPESDMVRVLFIKPHPAWSYNAGDIVKMYNKVADALSIGDYIVLVPDDYVVPVVEGVKIPESEFIEVVFLRAHPQFSYKRGDIGKVLPDAAKILLKDDYADLFSEDLKIRTSLFEKMGIPQEERKSKKEKKLKKEIDNVLNKK
jgi:hypothetical protein